MEKIKLNQEQYENINAFHVATRNMCEMDLMLGEIMNLNEQTHVFPEKMLECMQDFMNQAQDERLDSCPFDLTDVVD